MNCARPILDGSTDEQKCAPDQIGLVADLERNARADARIVRSPERGPTRSPLCLTRRHANASSPPIRPTRCSNRVPALPKSFAGTNTPRLQTPILLVFCFFCFAGMPRIPGESGT
jgi:hypothetical protein